MGTADARLLKSFPDPAYPDEFLLSRLRARRARQILEWRLTGGLTAPAAAPGGRPAIQLFFQRELHWLYRTMNGRLRLAFTPVFVWFELKHLFIALRHREGNSPGDAAGVLEKSLLADSITKALIETPAADDIGRALRRTHTLFAGWPAGNGMAMIADAERRVTERFLLQVLSEPHPAPVAMFFSLIADGRNIMAAHAKLRWGDAAGVSFVAGGRISPRRLSGILSRQGSGELRELVGKTGGVRPDEATGDALEEGLAAGMTRTLRRAAADPLGSGVIMDYIWRCHAEARNLGLALYGRAAGAGKVSAG